MAEVLTDADILMEILSERGKAPISLIAHVVGVPEDTVEQWAKILEKNNLVRIHYPILGEPVVEMIAGEEIKSELKTQFLHQQILREEKIREELAEFEINMKNPGMGRAELLNELNGKLAKVGNMAKKIREVAPKLGLNEEKILERYKQVEGRYLEMKKKLVKPQKGEEMY